MKMLSRKVGREREYNFLYHGTSRFVHFSTHEIFRRAWGRKGEVSIGSNSFAQYWQDFALCWSLRLFLALVVRCQDVLTDADFSSEKIASLSAELEEIGVVPIITAEELSSWERH
jgi:hypothetical protein